MIVVLAWLIATLALYGSGHGLRTSAIAAFSATAATVLATTEVLSLMNALTAPWLWSVWGALTVGVALLARDRLAQGARRLSATLAVRRSRSWWLFASVFALFGVGTLASALLYPPANFDSLTAHMPRVFFWIQNQSVGHYPTSFGPQLFSGNLVTYFILQLKLLAGGSDRLVGLAQWSAYGLSITTVSLIAKRLGARSSGQRFAALAAAVTPMAVLQASTTQTDLMMALWCLVAVNALLGYLGESDPQTHVALAWAGWAGLALGLAAQTKASAYLVCLPFFLYAAAVVVVRRTGWRRLSLLVVTVACAVLLLNAAQFSRNIRLLDGDPLASRAPGMDHILVTDKSPEALVTNSIKNTSLLLGTPVPGVNALAETAIRALVKAYGGRIENPRTQEAPSGDYHLDGRIANHDVAPAPLIALLLLASLAVLPWRSNHTAASYAACAITAMFLIASLVSWNVFINRILLAPLLLMIPLAGVARDAARTRGRVAIRMGLATLLVGASAWGGFVMIFNSTHRLVSPSLVPAIPFGRDVGWWNTSYDDLRFRVLIPHLEQPFRDAAAAVAATDAERVGIRDHVAHFPIHPLLHLLQDREVGYVDLLVLPDRLGYRAVDPNIVIEIIPPGEYATIMADGYLRGDILAGPIDAGDAGALLVYEAR